MAAAVMLTIIIAQGNHSRVASTPHSLAAAAARKAAVEVYSIPESRFLAGVSGITCRHLEEALSASSKTLASLEAPAANRRKNEKVHHNLHIAN